MLYVHPNNHTRWLTIKWNFREQLTGGIIPHKFFQIKVAIQQTHATSVDVPIASLTRNLIRPAKDAIQTSLDCRESAYLTIF